MLVAEVTPELIISLIALAGAASGAMVALLKIGPDREVTIVGAQDTVIDNLREEIDRHKAEREESAQRHRRRLESAEKRIADLERQQELETANCERRLNVLSARNRELTERVDELIRRTEGEQ